AHPPPPSFPTRRSSDLAEGGYQEFTLRGGEWFVLIGSALTAVLALAVGFFLMRGVLASDQGTPKMVEIAKAIQEGALAYLRRQRSEEHTSELQSRENLV